MGVTTTKTNKPLNPRGNDQSPLAYNRAKLYIAVRRWILMG